MISFIYLPKPVILIDVWELYITCLSATEHSRLWLCLQLPQLFLVPPLRYRRRREAHVGESCEPSTAFLPWSLTNAPLSVNYLSLCWEYDCLKIGVLEVRVEYKRTLCGVIWAFHMRWPGTSAQIPFPYNTALPFSQCPSEESVAVYVDMEIHATQWCLRLQCLSSLPQFFIYKVTAPNLSVAES